MNLRPQRRNANKHSEHGLRLLEKSLQQDGWIDAQTIAADGEMISGSARLEVAGEKFADVEPIIVESDGTRPVIVKRTDIPNADDPRARRLSVAANQIAHTDWNPDGELLKEWGNEDKDIRAMFADSEWEEMTGEEMPSKDAEPQIDRAAELLEKWQVKTGDLWQIGEHRLLCGDSTKREDVERVNNSEYDMIADPPYNVGFNYASITDDKDAQAWKEFCNAWFSVCSKNAKGSIVTPGPRNERLYPEPRDKGIWAKKNATAGASCFHLRVCEPILFYGKFDHKRNTDLFEYSSGFSAELTRARLGAGVAEQHPPAKSMPLWLELIGMLGDVVFDPFGGNGTTLLACENLHKKGRMIELYPAYCSVIIERMSQAFPKLEIRKLE